MANTIRIKRRGSGGATGAPSSLENAELAFNEADNILYYGKGTGGAGGTATSVEVIGGIGAFVTNSTAQTITGNKTFSGVVIVPTPSANTHATTKAYVDGAVANASSSFTISGDSGTNQTVTSADTLTISGGVGLSSVGSNTDTLTINLDNTAVTAGNYGNASAVGGFTVDAQGRLTSASNTAIAITASQITDRATNLVTQVSGTGDQITVSNSGVGAVTLSLSSNVNVSNNLIVGGNLTVQGNTVTLNTETLVVEDKNIVLGNSGIASNITADGGGITLSGGLANDKTFNWVSATTAWTSSEDLNLLTGKVFEINGNSVLSSTTLGSGVTGSSLTSVGTISTGVWNGSTIGVAYGGTGYNTYANSDLLYGYAGSLLKLSVGTSGQFLKVDGMGGLSWSDSVDGGTF